MTDPQDNGIVWEDPPKSGRGSPSIKTRMWSGLLEQLKAQPGKWARIREYETAKAAYSAAKNLKSGVTTTPTGSWEFAARKNANGGGYVYARYLGPEDSE